MRLSSVFLSAAAALCLLAVGGVSTAEDEEFDLLLDAIAEVESRNEPNAVGDSGRAVGVYQIHRPYWEDGTRFLGVKWKYGEAKDPRKARQVVRAYLSHYGKGKSLIDMARIHNGGPRGYQKNATREYARRIEAVLLPLMNP
jgi:soluble lytic murein transglycosylase-like protein